jgi:integrase
LTTTPPKPGGAPGRTPRQGRSPRTPGNRIWLPLLKDVGWAVIDYVRAGRPASDCPQVFLRHTAPAGPFSDQEHLHQMLVKYARAAHVPLGGERQISPHTFRHTAAVHLLEAGVEVNVIRGWLGHADLATTNRYANSRELHQPSEKPQVSRSRQGRDSVPCPQTAAV